MNVAGSALLLALLWSGCSKEPTATAITSEVPKPGAPRLAGQDFILLTPAWRAANPRSNYITFNVYRVDDCEQVGTFYSSWYGSGYYTVRYDITVIPGSFRIYDAWANNVDFMHNTRYYIVPSDDAGSTFETLHLHVDRYDPENTLLCETALWVIEPDSITPSLGIWDRVENNCLNPSWGFNRTGEYYSFGIAPPFICNQ